MDDTGEQRFWENLSSVPTDVYVVLGLVALANLIVALPLSGHVRTLVVLPLLLVLPGYAFTTVVFPDAESGIGLVERAALSFGLSIAIVPLLLIATPTPVGLTDQLVVSTVGVATILLAIAGALRRARRVPGERFEITSETLAVGLETDESRTMVDVLLSTVLLVSAIAAVGGLGYAIVAPQDGSAYTSVSLVTDDGDEVVAADYPTELEPGDTVPITLSIENHEGRPVRYSVLVTLDRVTADGTTISSTEVDRYRVQLDPGDTFNRTTRAQPVVTGRLRLTFLVYLEGVPDNPGRDNAYRSLHLWLDVDEATGDDGTTAA